MNRRTLLATVGSTLTLGAGCVSQSSSEEPTTTADPRDVVTTTATATADTPTPIDIDSRFVDISCPSFAEADRTVCYHTLAGRSPAVYVAPSTELFEPTTDDDTVETVEFTLHNHSGASFGLNPHAWQLHERTDGGWSFVAPEEYVEPWNTVPSGETYTWHLSVEQHSTPMSEDTMTLVQDLATGVYAFQITGFVAADTEEATNVECIALFEVQRTA
jgi:hypothetical protein